MTSSHSTTRVEGVFRAVTARLFSTPRPFTATSLGGPTLVYALLEQRGLHEQARRLREALAPLLRQLEVADITELPGALHAFRGRPPNAIGVRLRSGEVAEALEGAFAALGWGELGVMLAGWRPEPSMAAVSGPLAAREVVERDELAGRLAGRVALFREAVEVDPAAWDMPPVDIDPGVRRTVVSWLEPGGQVPAAARHPNRLGRILAAAAADRVEAAVRARGACAEAETVVVEAVCLLAAVAEAVTARAGARSRTLTVPSRLEPVAPLGWWPSRWWPVLDAWGAVGWRGRARMSTVWMLSPVSGDVVVAALLWALGALGSVAGVGERVRSAVEWRRRWAREMDGTWGPVGVRVWGLVQSVRPAEERSASPFVGGGLSRVSWGRSWWVGEFG